MRYTIRRVLRTVSLLFRFFTFSDPIGTVAKTNTMGLHKADLRFQLLPIPTVVNIQERNVAARCGIQPQIPCCARPSIFRSDNWNDATISFSKSSQFFAGIFSRTIINNDVLPICQSLHPDNLMTMFNSFKRTEIWRDYRN